MISMGLIKRCVHILRIARRPTRKELDEILKVTSLGMVFVGTVGMVMYTIFTFI